ncbi:hypothetical protein BJV74DRAFT_248258 [Russula compacta]|nr:hypothetical protein BJV74DRAFT_248258 [Russula compacta]
MPPVLINPDTPIKLGVFDWNSISDPLQETASSMSQPAVVYVPSPGLTSQLLESPYFGHDAKTRPGAFSDLGSLEDLGSSLQFRTADHLPIYPLLLRLHTARIISQFLWKTLTGRLSPSPSTCFRLALHDRHPCWRARVLSPHPQRLSRVIVLVAIL